MMSDQEENELQRAVGRIEGKLNLLCEELPSLSKRVTKIESWQNKLIGAGAAVGAVFGFAFKYITTRHS